MVQVAGSDKQASWPLLGRERVLELIESAYESHGGAVLIGEAGMGRTRLAGEAAAHLAHRGCPTAMATATRSAATVPLGAFAHLLGGDAVAGSGLDAYRLLMAGFGDRAAPAPVLMVDDAHLLDDASVALVHHLAVTGKAFVLLTVRRRERVPEAVTALWMQETVQRVELSRLPGKLIERLLTLALGGPMDVVSRQRLCSLAGGNPLLLREILRAGHDSGALSRVGGWWRWNGRNHLTDRLVDVVRTQMDTLAPGLVSLAEVLAYGEPLALSILESVAGSALVFAAERCELMTVERSGARLTARLTQPLYGEVIRACTPMARQREIASALADAVERTPAQRLDDVATVAKWRHRGALAISPEALLQAAEQARDGLDLGLAARLATDAQLSGAGPTAALLLAEVHLEEGSSGQAAAILPPLPEDLDEATRGRWFAVLRRIGYWRPDRLATATERWTVDRPVDRVAESARALLLVYDGDNSEAWRVAKGVLGGSGLTPAAANQAAAAAVMAAGLLGNYEDATEVLSSGLARATRYAAALPWGSTQVGGGGCIALLATGRLNEAWDLADHGYGRAVDLATGIGPDAMRLVGVWAALRGVVAKAQGRVETALTNLDEATALFEDWPLLPQRRLLLALMAATHALAGDLAAAKRRLEQADGTTGPSVPLCEPWVERARAWVTAGEGHLSQAAAEALNAGELARATQQPTVEALALYDTVRFGGLEEAVAPLEALGKELRQPVVSALASIASALRNGDEGNVLDEATEVLAENGHLLYAAEAAIAAYQHHTRAGRPGSAQSSLVKAAGLKRACEGARTPLLGPVPLRSVLTAREHEVAALAASGHSGGEIAGRLGISTRTVNNHLGRVYEKLGISGRRQLNMLLAEP